MGGVRLCRLMVEGGRGRRTAVATAGGGGSATAIGGGAEEETCGDAHWTVMTNSSGSGISSCSFSHLRRNPVAKGGGGAVG